MKSIYELSFIAILLMASCNSENTTTEKKHSKRKKTKKTEKLNPSKFISNHYEKAKVPFSSFTYTPGKDTTMIYGSGTELIIPSNAFIDANGNVIKENVKIEYREFHSTAQILASGIPMTIGEGIENTFMSAGMCEFKASVNNKPININPENPIENKLSSQRTGSEYNLYYFNEKTGKWEENGKDELTDNVEKKGGPTKPLQQDPNKEIFEITEGEKPELEKYYNWIFQTVDNTDFTDYASYLKDIRIEKKGYKYEITLINHNRQKMVMLCNRVFSPGQGFNTAITKYNKDLEVFLNKHIGEKIIMRRFTMNKTGIYNCDSPLLQADGFNVYTFSPDEGKTPRNIRLMDKTINAVFWFSTTEIRLNPFHENFILFSDDKEQLKMIDNSQINKWKKETINKCSASSIELKNAAAFDQLFRNS